MTLVLAYKGLGFARNIGILDSDGGTITPESGDLLRVTIGRIGETAKFTVTSGTNTDNGSYITLGASNKLWINGDDLAFDAGTYSFFVEFFDASEGAAGEWKNVERETFTMEDSTDS